MSGPPAACATEQSMSKGPIDPFSLSRRVLLPEVFHVARVFWYTAYGGIIDKLDEAGPG